MTLANRFFALIFLVLAGASAAIAGMEWRERRPWILWAARASYQLILGASLLIRLG